MNKTVCIVGLGLIGGSLGMAIRRKSIARVIGLTREMQKIGSALEKKAIDFGTTNAKGAVKEADMIFLCYPIHLIVPELKKILKYVKPGSIITDVGSTKEAIVRKIESIMPDDVFYVGGHPMAGKEKTGLDMAEGNLFVGRNYILTRTNKTSIKALNELRAFLSQLGANVVILPPDVHDLAVAGISHMPIAVASALVNSIGSSGKLKGLMKALASSGFRDSTRIASGDPTLAVDMFTTNRKAVLQSIKAFKASLKRLESLIRAGNAKKIRKELSGSKRLRDSIYK